MPRSWIASTKRGAMVILATSFVLAFFLVQVADSNAETGSDISIREALAQAQSTGRSVQATSETTETDAVFANPDGSLTATVGAGPQQEPDASSPTGWSPIDLSLQEGKDGYAPKLPAVSTSFSDGGEGTMATLSRGPYSFSQSWEGSLPSPNVKGNVATYADVLPGIDLQLEALTTGFEQSLILHSAPHAALTFDSPLSLQGVSAQVDNETGALIFRDAKGTTVASAGTPEMFGAATDPVSGEPLVSAPVTMRILALPSPVLEISPDPSFFDNPKLTYPVTIDPAPDLVVSSDTWVRQSVPTSNHSTDVYVKVGTPDGSDVDRALLQFDLTSLTDDGMDASSASLNLYENDSGSCTASEVDVYDASSAWDSTTVTWNTQPSVGSLYASATAAYGHSGSCPSNWVNMSTGGAGGLTLANLVQSWAQDPSTNNGLVVKAASETASTAFKQFRSLDAASNTPTLTITYTTCTDEFILSASSSSGTDDPDSNDGTQDGYLLDDTSEPVACSDLTADPFGWHGTAKRKYTGSAPGGFTQNCWKTETVNRADVGTHRSQIQGLEQIICNLINSYGVDMHWAAPGWVELVRDDVDTVENTSGSKDCYDAINCFFSTPWYPYDLHTHCFQSIAHSQLRFLGESHARNYTTLRSGKPCW